MNTNPPPVDPSSSPTSQHGLLRELGPVDATLVVVGIVVGSGIFLTTGVIAAALPSPGLILLVWALGGALSLAGALSFAELGAAWPESGGLYVYLREAWGPSVAFLFGWLTLLVYQTGAAAAVAVGFAEYLGYFLPFLGTDRIVLTLGIGSGVPVSAGQLAACVAILLFTATNVRGVREASVVQNVLTVLKVGAIATFAAAGLGMGVGTPAPATSAAAAAPGGLIAAMGVALVAVLWTFDGWHNVTFTAGEVKDPERNLPRALIGGTVVVTVLYLLTNAAYLRALPMPELVGQIRVAERAATALFGGPATALISGVVIVSTLGALNGVILTGARVYFAMARDGLFFESVGRVHREHRTPHVALWLQGAWACALALSGGYEALFTYTTFAALLIYFVAGAAVFRLRAVRPDVPRPYRIPGYPFTPGVFLLAVAVLLLNTVVERPVESLSGLGLLALGVPAYLYWRRKA